MFLEIQENFSSLEQWHEWANLLPVLRSGTYIDQMAHSIAVAGFLDPCCGAISPSEVTIDSRNYRESILAKGLSSRYRALSTLLFDHVLKSGVCVPIYLGEDLTAFSDLLSERFPYLLKSAALANSAMRMKFPNIRHEDPLSLSFPNRSFDVYLAPEIIVYSSSMENFLSEAYRILRKTGVLLATFSFRHGESDTLILSEQKSDGTIVHHANPVFQINPLSGTRSRLVYFVPAWDILSVARKVGFRSAEIVVQSSRKHAILGEEIAVIFTLRATA